MDPEVQPGIDEDEIGLEEDEKNGEENVEPQGEVEAWRLVADLDERDRLQGQVYQRPEAEHQGSEANCEAAVTLEEFYSLGLAQ